MKEKIPSLSTRISDNSGYQEVDEADIETNAAQEVTAGNGDNISEVTSEFGTFCGVLCMVSMVTRRTRILVILIMIILMLVIDKKRLIPI